MARVPEERRRPAGPARKAAPEEPAKRARIGCERTAIEDDPMNPSRQEDIRRRAHEIWEQEGKPEGKEAEHWDRAMRELEGQNHSASEGRNAVQSASEGSGAERMADDLQSGSKTRRR